MHSMHTAADVISKTKYFYIVVAFYCTCGLSHPNANYIDCKHGFVDQIPVLMVHKHVVKD